MGPRLMLSATAERVFVRRRRPYPGWCVQAIELFIWRLALSAGWVTDMSAVPRKWCVRVHPSYSYGAGLRCVTVSIYRLRIGAAWRVH